MRQTRPFSMGQDYLADLEKDGCENTRRFADQFLMAKTGDWGGGVVAGLKWPDSLRLIIEIM